MSALLDVQGCQVLASENPGYYKCRTISKALASKFVRIYGGRAKFPTQLVPDRQGPGLAVPRRHHQWQRRAGHDQLGAAAERPVRRPRQDHHLVLGDLRRPARERRHDVRRGRDGSWQDSAGAEGSSSCFRVQLVNRYGAGHESVSRLMSF